MSCSVSLGGYDEEPAGFYNETIVTARKAHVCYECRGRIEPMQQYERITGKWEGDVRTYRFCLPCSEISHEFSDGGRVFGNVWETFVNAWEDGAHLQACLNRVSSVAAKQKLRDEWLKYKGLSYDG